MKVGKAIYSILRNDGDVNSLVDTRIFPLVAKNDTRFPFIIYDVGSENPEDTKDGVSTLDVDSVMVSVYSQSYEEASDLARKVRTALDRVSGSYEGVEVQSIQYNGLNEIFDENVSDEGVYRKALDFNVRIVNTEVAQPFSNFLSLDFDGVDDYVNCGNSSTIRPETISISAWVNPNAWDWANPGSSQDHNEYIVGNVAVGGWGLYLEFAGTEANPTTKLNFIVRVKDTGSGSAGYVTATIPSATVRTWSGWKYVTCVFDGNAVKLYYDGANEVSISTAVGTTIDYSTNPLYSGVDVVIGADPFSNSGGVSGESIVSDFYYGNIDEIAIFNEGIAAVEVLGLYNNSKPFDLTKNQNGYVSSANLMGYWRNGDNDTYPTITDKSTNTNDGAMKNMSSNDIVNIVP